ncbi:MAG: S9 family peptidase [Sphaerobacter sp.]|nr:S9 family peptidase [Sphaerobacter sp.]MDI3341374.1 S9 family peptidase [Sphaerobacter sp.]
MARPLSPTTLVYDLTAGGDPQVSPDGSRILYTYSTVDRERGKPVSHLWLCDIDGANRRQVTFGGEREGVGRWSPDGRQIAFVSDRVPKSGIFVMPIGQPGEARELTRHGQPITDLAWSPDGTRIAYTTTFDPENPTEAEPPPDAPPRVRVTRRIDYKQDGRGYLNDARSHVWVVDVATGERRRITDRLVDHFFPQWSPDGRMIAVQVPNRNGMCSQLGLIPADGGELTLVGPEDGVVGVWSWSPSGDRIVFAGDTVQTHQLDFFVYDVASGTVRRVTDDLPVLPMAGYPGQAAPSHPVWLDDQRILFHAVRGGASGLYTLDLRDGRLETVQTWQALHVGLSTDNDRRYIVQGYASLEGVGEIAVYDRQRGDVAIVTDHNVQLLREASPARWERFDVQRGEFTIEAWLLFPPDFDPNKRYPVVLDVHGGPNGYYGYGFVPWQQVLATHGFLVVFSNPRGSSSYGRHFTMQVTEDWGGEDFKDLMAVVDAVLERPYADPSRTGIFGYSYGGYMTAWAIGQTDRFQAAVCGAPCFDLVSMYGTSDISHTFGEQQWGGPPHEAREWYITHSPATYAHRAKTPTLIIHGEADERCPIGQGEQMFVALKKAGCEVEFVRYPGASHSLLRLSPPAHREDVLTRILGWFKQHLGEPA